MSTVGGTVEVVDAGGDVLFAALNKRSWKVATARHRAFGWDVHTVREMAEGTFFVSRAAMVVALHPTTWRTLCHEHSAQNALIERAERSDDGVNFLPMDVGIFADAVRAEARVLAETAELDALGRLEQDVQHLLSQASGVNAAPSVVQTQLFMAHYSSARAQAQAFQERLTRLHALIEVAGAAVVEASTR